MGYRPALMPAPVDKMPNVRQDSKYFDSFERISDQSGRGLVRQKSGGGGTVGSECSEISSAEPTAF